MGAVRRETVPGSMGRRLPRSHAASQRLSTANAKLPAEVLANENALTLRLTVSERDFGRLEENARQTEARVNRIEDEVYERKRNRQAVTVSWWQIVIAGLFVLGASFGSAAVLLLLD